MKFEMDIVRATTQPDPKTSTTPSRKALRESTDDLIRNALWADDLPGLVGGCGEAMLVIAACLVQFEQEPGIPDFIEAAQANIEQGRAVMDRGLVLNSWETVKCGAVMLEITMRGICAALSVPYDLVLTEVHRARQAGESPAIRRILTDAGLLQPVQPEAANDAAADS